MKKRIACVLATAFWLGAMPAAAADFSFSGFSTVGYARSDQEYNYQRFVNDQGTLKLDSVLGVQMDAKFNNEFGLTLQGKLAPSISSDTDIDPTVSWAFVSWRPSNDWLVRLGRIRVPLYLHSENMAVGATFDFARLPTEVYNTAQTTDGDGVHVSKTWSMDANELTLLGYVGSANTDYRFFRRDDEPSLSLASGSYFVPVTMNAKGAVLTLQREEDTFRIGVHDSYTKITDDQTMPVTFPYVTLLPGVGYYQTSNLMPGPGVATENNIHVVAFSMGADVMLGKGFRVMGEYVRRDVRNIETGPDTQGAYIALLKSIGAWTPYINVAWLRPTSRTRDLYNQVNSNTLTGFFAALNPTQRAGADGIMASDQTTWALGASYRMTTTSKIKAEVAQTRTGDMSFLVDAPPGGESGHQVINVVSLSYNLVF